MAQRAEIIVIPADIVSVKGWQVFWAFSKKQLDMILHEIELLDKGENPQDFYVSTALWQQKKMAVVSLEKYFGFPQRVESQTDKCAVLKDVLEKDGGMELGRIMVQISGNVRVREVDFTSLATAVTMLPTRHEDVRGIYSLSDKRLLVMPDVAKIYANCLR